MSPDSFSASSDLPRTRGALARVWTGRILTGLLTALYAMGGIANLMKAEFAVEGAKQQGIPESALTGIAIAVLVSAILYAIPQTSMLGAILLTGYMGGAVMTHVFAQDPPVTIAFAVFFGALVWMGIYLREPRLWPLVPWRR